MKKEIYRQFIDTIFDYEAKETTDKVAIDKAMEKYGPNATVLAMPFGGATLPIAE